MTSDLESGDIIVPHKMQQLGIVSRLYEAWMSTSIFLSSDLMNI